MIALGELPPITVPSTVPPSTFTVGNVPMPVVVIVPEFIVVEVTVGIVAVPERYIFL